MRSRRTRSSAHTTSFPQVKRNWHTRASFREEGNRWSLFLRPCVTVLHRVPNKPVLVVKMELHEDPVSEEVTLPNTSNCRCDNCGGAAVVTRGHPGVLSL